MNMSIMTLANMSLVAVPLITVIAAIRFFALYKLPKKTFNILWAIVLFSLLIPYNPFARFDISVHITALGEKVSEIFVKAPKTADIVSTAENARDISNNIIAEDISPSVFYNIFETVDRFGRDMYDRIEMLNITGTDILAGTAESTTNPTNLFISFLPLIWLVGFLCFSAYFIVTHIKCRRIYDEALPSDSGFVRSWRVEYSDSMRRKVKIRQSDLIRSPLTYGIFKPVILLPCDADYSNETTLKYILFHEYTHIRRFDTLAKLFLAAALCVHWFNPFVWFMYILANRDIELTCDEAVVRESMVGEDIKLNYASTLIALSEKKNILTLGVHFSRNIMKERIKSIMKIKKQSKLRITAAVVLIFMLIAMLGTLQSCEDNIGSGVEIIEITNEQGEVIETQEIVVPLEPFEMQEQTDKLVVYMNSYGSRTYTLTPAINIFKEKYPDVEVEIVDNFNMTNSVEAVEEYRTILTTELAAGKGPDLVLAAPAEFPDIYKTMATEIFVDLNQFISRDSKFNFDEYNKGVLNAGVYLGKRYLIPVEYGVPILLTTQEILDAEGINPKDLSTFDGFVRVLEQYNEKHKDNPNKSIFRNEQFNSSNLRYFFPQCGIDLINYQTGQVAVNKAKFKSIIDLYKQMYVRPENEKTPVRAMAQMRDALINQNELFNLLHGKFNTVSSWIHESLAAENLTPLYFTYPNINDGVTADIYQFAAIPKASKNQINAYNLLKIILSEEIQGGIDNGLSYLLVGNPVMESAVRAIMANDLNFWDSPLEEEFLDKCAEMTINVTSAEMKPHTPYNVFIMEEMVPYFEGAKSFDDCYARLVSKLEIYISE